MRGSSHSKAARKGPAGSAPPGKLRPKSAPVTRQHLPKPNRILAGSHPHVSIDVCHSSQSQRVAHNLRVSIRLGLSMKARQKSRHYGVASLRTFISAAAKWGNWRASAESEFRGSACDGMLRFPVKFNYPPQLSIFTPRTRHGIRTYVKKGAIVKRLKRPARLAVCDVLGSANLIGQRELSNSNRQGREQSAANRSL